MPATTGVPGSSPSSVGGAGCQPAQHAAGRHQLGQRRSLETGQLDQCVVVGNGTDVAVVGDPVHGDGVVRGAGQTGQAQVQVVDGLEEHRGGRVDVGALLAQEVDVAHRVLAREARDPAGAPHPAGELGGGVPLDIERAADRLTNGAGPARVHPDDGRSDGDPPRRRRARCPTTARCSPTPTILSGVTPLSASARRARGHDGVPPRQGGLLRPAVVGQLDAHRLERVGHDPTGRRQHRHLGPTGPEVDREDVGVLAARGVDGTELGGRNGRRRPPVQWAWRGSVPSVAGPFRARPTLREVGLRRSGRPRSRSRSRPCCPPRRCRRAASG